MRKKQRNKRFIKRFQSELITFNVGILAMSTLLTLPSAAMLATTNEGEPVIQIQEEGIWREQGLDREYGLEEDFLGEMNLAADEKEDTDYDVENLRETSIEVDEEDSDSEEENLRESNIEEDKEGGEEADLSQLNEENDEEEDLSELDEENDEEEEEDIELIPVIGVNEKAELEIVEEKAEDFEQLQNIVDNSRTGVNTVITVTAGFDFPSVLNITAGRHITIQSDIEMNSHESDIEMELYELKHIGDTRHFILNNDSSLTLEMGIVLDGRTNDAVGGGIQVNNGGHFIMNGGVITNCRSANNGGGVNIDTGGEFTMKKGTITANIASAGGGVNVAGSSTDKNVGGHFTMVGGTISNNESINSAGGVRVQGTFEMAGGYIEKNTSGHQGGGLSIMQQGSFIMEGGTIDDNSATVNGGGIYLFENSIFIMNGGSIDDNSATVNGGGVYLLGPSTFTMDGGSIDDNSATGNGGGVYLSDNSTFTMTGGSIIKNHAEADTQQAAGGGGVYLFGHSTFTMTGGNIISNHAHYGGGVRIQNNAKFTMDGEEAVIYDNEATLSGGGVLANGTFTMVDGLIDDNKAIEENGGGISVWEGSQTDEVVMWGGTISNNKANQFGGGASIQSGSEFTLEGGKIHTNFSGSEGGGVHIYQIRGTSITGGTFNMKGGKIYNNTATTYGGGVNIRGSLNMEDGKIFDNEALDSGGGIFAWGTLNMEGGEISENEATNLGGGVYASGVVMLGGVNIYKNTAYRGGGIYSESNKIIMTGGTISENEAINQNDNNPYATPNGGGVWVSGNFEMSGGKISDNTAESFGGGVYVNSNGTFTSTEEGLIIRENRAKYGGGVHVVGKFEMSGGDITKNTAFNNGAGVMVQGEFEMKGGQIHDNEAKKLGGGVFVDVYGTFDSTEGLSIHKNRAVDGAGVAIEGQFEMNGGDISNNEATGNGGGVHSSGELVMTNGEISKNKAAGDGGGIYADTIDIDKLSVGQSVTFEKNSAAHSYPPPLGAEELFERIKSRSSSIPRYSHPLNNYDIGYKETDPPIYMLSILRSPEFGGDVVVAGETNLNQLGFMKAELSVDLEAKPKPGYRFVGWENSDGEFTSETDMKTVFTTPGHDTEITAIFQRIMILDPLNPDEVVNPANPPFIPEAEGNISIDFVSSFDFGEQTISTQKRDYYAKPQRLLDESGKEIENEERPNYIQISDNRADNNGWTLSVTQMGPFKDGEDVLRGADLTLQYAELVSAPDATLSSSHDYKQTVTLKPHVSEPLIEAKPGESQGTWIYRFGNETNFGEGVKLEVPRGANPSKTTYRTTLNWELKSVPSKLE